MTKKSNVDKSKPFQRVGRSYPEDLKKILVQEVESGRLSQRAVERTYKINRRTIDSWITQFSLLPLIRPTQKPMKEPNESSKIKLLSKQVLELQKALEKANLKINGLETLIQVSEEELKIKIRKKPGAKQSKE
ncbi:transposase [Sphingobacterium multivorum]|uniref:Transposase n=2 Tax=Sphingobacteriaceae TaxID=84566 RepID=A0A2X2IUG6_SPHMU|nr:transposase [Sphingobacterium multivorum]QRQ59653.1 hypothetical protein I6J33_15875 [Sphingobacterium multivorum]SPZ84964.1 Uncharacterised protein [Sphingobacterium multivorum]